MTAEALTRAELDRTVCQAPNCDHTAHDGLHLHAGCHPRSPLTCEYRFGVLTFRCARCTQFVTRIAVAEGVRPDGWPL
jgi:hypothetical protein